MTTNEFVPAFREDVVVQNPDGSQTPVNSSYCATDQCAEDLRSILQDLGPVIAMAYPLGDGTQFGGSFAQSSLVPWLVFPNYSNEDPQGVVRGNAGQLASYWTHGLQPATAEANCRKDIENMKAGR